MSADASLDRALALARQGQFAAALGAVQGITATERPAAEALDLHADLLKAIGDLDQAVVVQLRTIQLYPKRRSAWHNLAATLGDAGRAEEAEVAARRTFTVGPAAPETWLVLGRALQSQARYDDAESAFQSALALRPGYVDAHRDLAQLRWMRTGTVERALASLDQALARVPGDAGLVQVRAAILEFAGDADGAYDTVTAALARDRANLHLKLAASSLALTLNRPGDALDHVLAVHRAAPAAGPTVLVPLIQALLGCGQAGDASALAGQWLAQAPDDQLAIALQLTAWRALGDGRYDAWVDYGTMVRPLVLETPEGWASLPSFLKDLAAVLEGLHGLKAHPLHQSLRGGSQTSQSLLRSQDPVLRAFFSSVHTAIGAYLAGLGQGSDPLRRRNSGDGAPQSAWSVRLTSGGSHADHVHPKGWVSSAFYVALPEAALSAGDQAGWIRFGQPPFPLPYRQPAGRVVKPEAGQLVLFPSYLWHGVNPFQSDIPRLTIAFDILPRR
jgi:tetratricopeptide (TPR) repeat protein